MMTRKFRPWTAAAAAIFLLGAIAALSGCATLDKDECLNADWYSIGYEDGAKGYKASYISRHRKACAKHGVAPDFATYEQGRAKGLDEWCAPRNGYQQGLRGGHYNGVCPGHLETGFVRALNHGRDIFKYEAQVKRQAQTLNKINTDLEILEQDLAGLEEELVRPRVSPLRRRQLLTDIRLLEDDQRSLVNDLADAEHTLADMQSHLEGLRAKSPYR